MIIRAALLWIAGLLTFVPWATYYLLFQAPREQYALLIVAILGWVFGYWGIAGPLLTGLKARAVFRSIQQAGSPAALQEVVNSEDARDVAIDFIATENRIPKFVARRVHALLIDRLGK